MSESERDTGQQRSPDGRLPWELGSLTPSSFQGPLSLCPRDGEDGGKAPLFNLNLPRTDTWGRAMGRDWGD